MILRFVAKDARFFVKKHYFCMREVLLAHRWQDGVSDENNN